MKKFTHEESLQVLAMRLATLEIMFLEKFPDMERKLFTMHKDGMKQLGPEAYADYIEHVWNRINKKGWE